MINEGVVTKIGNIYGLDGDLPETDEINSIIVAAEDENDAINLANQYDAREIGIDNLTLGNGTVISCVLR